MTYSIRGYTTFSGPNGWNRTPVTHVIVEAATNGQAPSDLDWAAESFAALAEDVHEGTSLTPVPLAEPVNPGALLANLALNLQRVAGVAVTFWSGGQRTGGGFDVVVQHRHAEVGLGAIRLALRWLDHLGDAHDPSFDLARDFGRFLTLIASNDHGVMGRAMAAAAEQRGIPATSIDPRGGIIDLGNGRYRKRLSGLITSSTAAIGMRIAQDKYLTNRFLRAAGLPVPDSVRARSLAQALQGAESIGYPVVIKPPDQGAGLGVVANIRDEEELRARFGEAASVAGPSTGVVVVERFIEGREYRATVVNDAVVAVSERLFPRVVGDGRQSIRALIDLENANPRRGTGPSMVYRKISVDHELIERLASMGFTLGDVPADGLDIVLRQSTNRRDGGMHVDVTDLVHPANTALLRTAARVVGLDVAGIDLKATDIALPILEAGGAIFEINSRPAFNLQLFPGAGQPRNPAVAYMEMLFPPGMPVRIPVVAVMGDAESTTVSDLMAQVLAASGRVVGLATANGVVIGGTRYPGVKGRNPDGPRTLLNNPDVDIAVVEVDAESIVEQGLGFDPCDVAVILSLSGVSRPDRRPIETVLLDTLDPAGCAMFDGSDREMRALVDYTGVPSIMLDCVMQGGKLDPLLSERILSICAASLS